MSDSTSTDGEATIIDLDWFLSNPEGTSLISKSPEELQELLDSAQRGIRRVTESSFGIDVEAENKLADAAYFIEAALNLKPKFDEVHPHLNKERR